MSNYDIPHCWINITKLPVSGESIELAVDNDILKSLASVTDVEAISSLEIKLDLKPWRRNGAVLDGTFHGTVDQICVATLEPIARDIHGKFQRYFIPEYDKKAPRPDIVDGEMILDPGEDDFPDAIVGEKLDIWDVVIEELNLEIDPFPRSTEAPLYVQSNETKKKQEPTHTPFADLKALITEKKS